MSSGWTPLWRRPHIVLAACLGALLLLGVLAALFPAAFYYPIVWKYYWGPLVSDSMGQPITRGGVTAYPGYNLVDTATWIVLMGASLWTLLDAFRRRGIHFTKTLTLSFLPMIVAGGTMRGLVELDWLPEPWAYAFITPNIYLVFFFYSLLALALGLFLERRTAGRIRHWHATLVAGIIAMLITFAGWATYIVATTPRWTVLWEIFGYSALLTAAIVLACWKFQFARDPYYVLVLYGQIVDGMQNYIGITKGYTSKLMGPNLLEVLGDPGLLVAKVVLFVPMLAYLKARVEPESDASTLHLLLLAILALGLAMGFHGGVPMLVGE